MTPIESTTKLARELEQGRLVTVKGFTHTGYQQQSPCVDDAVDRYLIERVAPPGDLDCTGG